jgi:thiol:disulfide interchange protein/DsbC/DsbD-like thiol-disulfide interchange protein
MNILGPIWLALALLPFHGSLSAAQAGFHTEASLLANVQSVQPGKPFTVGLRLRMSPGWHTYWVNPGESGLATSIQWTLPEGFQAGEIQWPLPEKTIESGDVLTYGYSGETLLMVSITPSPLVPPGSHVTLKARAEWLECQATCVPGAAAVELTLPVLADSASPAHEALFAGYRAKLPRQRMERSDPTVEYSVSGGQIRLTVHPASTLPVHSPGDLDFYPAVLDGYVLGRTFTSISGDTAIVSISFTPGQDTRRAGVVHGVLVATDGQGRRSGMLIDIQMREAESSDGKKSGILEQTFRTDQPLGDTQSLGLYLVFALVGGLLLNVMPCVLPVIALKIFGLVRMAGDNPARVKKLGWFFSLGIVASFLSLALFVSLLKVAGQQVGWGFQFQEPLFVIAMSAVVFAFGLSLFGVFEIRVPSAAVSGVGSVLTAAGSAGNGYRASFLEGVFATILATPCTAPFLGTALGFAFAQSWWVILLVFTTVALGMALPYLILTVRPGWMKYLPKPGAWMETAKQFMGFFMMATLLWLLYILGKQLGMEALIWTGAFLLSVGVACWLIGRFATLTVTRARYLSVVALAILIVAGGYLWFVEGILNVRGLIAGSPGEGAATELQNGIAWEPFSLQRLESRLNDNKPVFLDFTAEWCLTCKVNERTVLADQSVKDKVRSSGVIPIRADWTNRNPDITRLLQKFGRSGVPLYVIFPAGKPTEPIVLPEVVTAGIVLDALEKAVGRQ